MADFRNFRVVILAYTSLFLIATIASSLAVCPERQYLNSKQQICMNCSECTDGLVVRRPCEKYRDTYCGPLEPLMKQIMGSDNRHRHHHHKHHRHEKEDIEWRYADEVNGKNQEDVPRAMEVASSLDVPFSNAETIVWDWQAIALTSAVFACIMFFLVVTLYSLHQARQWRRLKENFEADVEELSARLSLMAASSSEKGDLLDGSPPACLTPTAEANYLNNRCVYLEQLLSVRKESSKVGNKPRGNVYIEENNPKT